MPQSCCLNVHAKCDLKQESKQVLEICELGRVTHGKKKRLNIMISLKKVQNLTWYIPKSHLAR